MGQKKLIKFAAIKAYENVLEFPQDMQGKWAAFFDALKRGQARLKFQVYQARTLLMPLS